MLDMVGDLEQAALDIFVVVGGRGHPDAFDQTDRVLHLDSQGLGETGDGRKPHQIAEQRYLELEPVESDTPFYGADPGDETDADDDRTAQQEGPIFLIDMADIQHE